MSSYRLLRRARADLLDIARYTADRWDEQQAEQYIKDLFFAFQRLVEFPELRRHYRPIPPYLRRTPPTPRGCRWSRSGSS
jgi:plasmid stabilization system protein ParE